MPATQIQIKISLSEQLNELLQGKASRLGVPVTQLVKYIIIKDIENEQYPTFQMTEKTEQKLKEAMEDYDTGHAVEVEDVSEFFKNL